MKNIFSLILLASTVFAGGGSEIPDTWLDRWLMPSSGLFIWSVITFLIVFAVLRWKAWGPLMETLDAREKQINDALNAAESAKEEAAKVASDNEDVLNKARQEAQEIVAQARDAGDKLKSKLETDGQAKYDEMLDKAKEQIDAEKQKALGEIKEMVVDVAFAASEKVIKRNLNNDDNKKMIEETVDEFKQAN
tara:strand:+ start:639 stop:1214 length:576 start_codon:yes stop_codon:yes gene_type:complete